MKNILLFIALYISIAPSCEKIIKSTMNENLLINCWTHSFEEDNEGGPRIMRPCSYTNFPGSKTRLRFDLMENNRVQYQHLNPADAHNYISGTWSYDANSDTLKIMNTNGDMVRAFRILSIADDKLEAAYDRPVFNSPK